MHAGYRTAPEPISTMPPGIPYIVGNEAAERFSFYGMKAILMVFMTDYLIMGAGQPRGMKDADANFYFHIFEASAYAFPIIGAFFADYLWGKYRTIIWLSLVYCFGHLALALDETRLGLFVGLGLVAIGTGGIKPCVSAHVGDQFGPLNKHLLERVYGWFYFSINFGALFSSLLTPMILARKWIFADLIPESHSSAAYAFGLPGVLMFIATIVFWLGRHKYAHIPPGGASFLKEVTGPEGRRTFLRLLPLYFFILFFWTLYDQHGSSWVQQAKELDCHIFGLDLLPAQLQAVNPLLVMIFIPLFNYVVYPTLNRWFRLTPLRKIGIGFLFTAAAFGVSLLIEMKIVDGRAVGVKPTALWQILAYAIITAGEVMVSITGLEYSYMQAPRRMKSLVMAFYLLSVSLGNVLTAYINHAISDEDGNSKITDIQYFALFTTLMLVVAVAFSVWSRYFKEEIYIQGDDI
ncbi:MAG: POT family MFS transporter [Planctomycetia bacterium]|nr:POT family MFS transporter [Planctomycetia bacterium]